MANPMPGFQACAGLVIGQYVSGLDVRCRGSADHPHDPVMVGRFRQFTCLQAIDRYDDRPGWWMKPLPGGGLPEDGDRSEYDGPPRVILLCRLCGLMRYVQMESMALVMWDAWSEHARSTERISVDEFFQRVADLKRMK